MLPGLRFLFAAIVLATSILVFGLGAAALLRAAHEEFASIPARPAPREPQFAQRTEAPPVLAMLRVDPPAADKVTTERPAPSMSATSEPMAPAEVSPPAESEKIAAVKTDDLPPPATPKSEAQATETTPPAPATDAAPQAPAADVSAMQQPAPEAAPAEPKLAAVADAPAVASEPAMVEPAAVAAAPSAEAIAAATKIATLGGPEVVIASRAAAKAAEAKKADQSATSKPAHRKERRHAHRTRQVVVQQQAVDPFGQTTTVTTVQRR